MILHIPHSSTQLAGLTVNPESVLLLTDHFTDDLFHFNGAETKLVSDYNRHVVDLERLVDDPLEAKGQGILYKKDLFGGEIDRSQLDNQALLDYFHQHHRNLGHDVRQYLAYFETCILVDCHSFGDQQLGRQNTPDFCIGFNNDTTYDAGLVKLLVNHFQTSGYSVGLNEPYAFSMSIANPPFGFYSVMIEVNKRLYMDIEQGQAVKNQHYEATKRVIHSALQNILEYEDDNGPNMSKLISREYKYKHYN